MKKGWKIFFILLFFASCSGKNKIPGDILPPAKMQAVIWDMLRADGFVSEYLSKDSSLNKKQESVKLYEEIFLIHKISKEDFQKSFSFYQTHPFAYKSLLDSLNADHVNEASEEEDKPVTVTPDTLLIKKNKR